MDVWAMSFFYTLIFLCALGFVLLFIITALEDPVAFLVSMGLIIIPTLFFRYAFF
jgi:hypothetical protein